MTALLAVAPLDARQAADSAARPAPAAPAPSRARRAAAAIDRAHTARAARKIDNHYDPIFRKYSKRYFGVGFDWKLFKAQGMAESDLKPSARSFVGARGIMQLMPSTYAAISSKQPEFKAIDDPEWNIAAGIMHDRYLWRLWKKDVDDTERYNFMFGSYNAGQGTIGRARGVARANQLIDTRWTSIEQIAPAVQRWRYRETLGYVKKIDANYRKLSAEDRR
jgi:membrane-bound lytic murein transglycosylase F